MSSSTSGVNQQSAVTSDQGRSEFLRGLDIETRGQTEALIIRAGAGAGKTTEMVKRVLSLIVKFQKTQARFPRLVVTTFTRKATQELRERLLLSALTLGDEAVLRFVQQSKSLQISTIHGTLRRFLTSFGPSVGLSPDFQLLDSVDESRLKKKHLRRLLDDETMAGHFEELMQDWDYASFWRAFDEWSDHLFLHPQAVAESARDIQQGVEETVAHFHQVVDRYLELAAGEKLTANREQFVAWLNGLRTQVQSRQGVEALAVWISASEDLPRSSSSKNWSENFLETQKELYATWKELAADDLSPEFVERFQGNTENFVPLATALMARIEEEKAQTSHLSLKDLELWSYKILQQFPEAGKQFSATWDYWMIDEFQDTSPLQVEILRGLVGDKNEFVVGDPQQSIYLFRGARSEVFALKEDEIRRKGGRQAELMTNYRSSPKLMAFLNRFLTELRPAQFAPMQIGGKVDKDLDEPQGIFWQLPEDCETLESEVVLARVQELIQAGVAAEKICVLGRANAPLIEFCHLADEKGVPTRFSGAAGFADRREVRDAMALLRFLVSPHDNLNLLTLLRSPWFATPDPEIAAVVQLGLASEGKEKVSYWKSLKAYYQDQQTPASYGRLQQALLTSETRGVTQAWLEALLAAGFIDQSESLDGSGQRESHFWRLLADLKFAERDAGFNFLKWIEKVEIGQITDEKSDDEAPAVIEPSRVQVMSIHASKGLQFEHVILGWAGSASFRVQPGPVKCDEVTGKYSLGVRGLESAKWVNSRWAKGLMAQLKEREIAEHDRFLYVAMTRAISSFTLVWKKAASLSWAARRPLWCELPPGQHEIVGDHPAFRIEVRDQIPALATWGRQLQVRSLVRKPWQELPPSVVRSETSSPVSGWQRFERIQRGVDIHRALELLQCDWNWAGTGETDSAVQETAALKKMLAQVREVDMRQVIEQGYAEWAFVAKMPEATGPAVGWYSGRIDLWSYLPGEQGLPGTVWIVDYKTGSAKAREKALTQLKTYAWALHQLGRVPAGAEVRLLPLFLMDEVSHQSERAPSFADLNRDLQLLLSSR